MVDPAAVDPLEAQLDQVLAAAAGLRRVELVRAGDTWQVYVVAADGQTEIVGARAVPPA